MRTALLLVLFMSEFPRPIGLSIVKKFCEYVLVILLGFVLEIRLCHHLLVSSFWYNVALRDELKLWPILSPTSLGFNSRLDLRRDPKRFKFYFISKSVLLLGS